MKSTQVSHPLQHAFEGQHTNQVSASMSKPYAYKVHYHNDGTGRDTYIGVSSGGLYDPRPYAHRPAFSFGKFNTRRSAVEPNPVMHAKPLHYRSDGSGRDSYVIRTEGGLAQDYSIVDQMTSFKRSLRDNPRITSAYRQRGDHDGGHSASKH